MTVPRLTLRSVELRSVSVVTAAVILTQVAD
jgi:hypothetical protein